MVNTENNEDQYASENGQKKTPSRLWVNNNAQTSLDSLERENEAVFTDDQKLTTDFVNLVKSGIEERDHDHCQDLYDILHPADRADLLGLLNDDERNQLIHLLGGEVDSSTLAELEDDILNDVVEVLSSEVVAEAVAELDTDDAVTVLEEVDKEKREKILAEVPVADRLAVRAALEFKEDSAGRMMQRDIFAAPAYWTVGQVIDRMREEIGLPDRFYEVFIIDPAYKPMGAVPLCALLRVSREQVIDTLMIDEGIRKIPVTMDQEEVAYLFEQYNLIAAPVIDENERLVGMITVDDVVEIIHEETHEDMLALAGVEADSGLSDTVVETVQSRIFWLGVNLCTAILASLVIWPFSDSIAAFVPLAVLMPIVASMGGNAGTQTLTVAVRALAMKDITASNATRIITREALVGTLNGAFFAVVMGSLAAIWYYYSIEQSPSTAWLLGFVVACAMVINLIAAGLAGILIPLGLQKAGHDPAIASAVFVTTVTDILGFFVFLGLGTVILTRVI